MCVCVCVCIARQCDALVYRCRHPYTHTDPQTHSQTHSCQTWSLWKYWSDEIDFAFAKRPDVPLPPRAFDDDDCGCGCGVFFAAAEVVALAGRDDDDEPNALTAEGRLERLVSNDAKKSSPSPAYANGKERERERERGQKVSYGARARVELHSSKE